ncbi:RNA polymerase sigma factor [Thalassospira marina]|uniref:RNA polymerase subunit sigma n=1 Tax=Thalassospira marina TaxID=2048283 RepID=A0ABM6QBF4_9PROT|nr:sigma-70 family RNA polymerase sigma factor [Thalassospira marina]AUG53881.1 RNA polymerase subunit sigma [Thalassospira marina]
MSFSLIEELHRKEEGRLRRFFMRRLRNDADAQDATQETFARLLGVAPKTQIENPQAYLFQIAKTVAARNITLTQAERSVFETVPDIENIAEDQPTPDRIVTARQYLTIMARAIEGLPSRCQEVFILSRLHGLPNGEIARQLGISRNMVEKHIMRALITCRDVRARLNGDPSTISTPGAEK